MCRAAMEGVGDAGREAWVRGERALHLLRAMTGMELAGLGETYEAIKARFGD
jgi:hypothetical protein